MVGTVTYRARRQVVWGLKNETAINRSTNRNADNTAKYLRKCIALCNWLFFWARVPNILHRLRSAFLSPSSPRNSQGQLGAFVIYKFSWYRKRKYFCHRDQCAISLPCKDLQNFKASIAAKFSLQSYSSVLVTFLLCRASLHPALKNFTLKKTFFSFWH